MGMMNREETLDWLCRLRSEIYVYMPNEWLIPMNNALDVAIKALEQEPTTKNDLPHCQCTDEEIAKSFIGDVEAVKDQLPTTKNDLGVDLISRKQAIEEADKLTLETGYDNEKVIEMLEDLPSVTPQEPFKPMVEIDLYSVIKQKYIEREVLDKIRAEIAEYGSIMVAYAITKETKTDKGIEKLVSGVLKQAKEQVLEIIDKYKAEVEPQESEVEDGNDD